MTLIAKPEEWEPALFCLVADLNQVMTQLTAKAVWDYIIDNMDEKAATELVEHVKNKYDTGWIYKAGMSYMQDALEAR